MIFDLNFPAIELRFRLHLIAKLISESMTRWLQIEIKIPWFKSWYFIYWYVTVIEISSMKRSQCWKFVLFNHVIRNYYDHLEVIENGSRIESS